MKKFFPLCAAGILLLLAAPDTAQSQARGFSYFRVLLRTGERVEGTIGKLTAEGLTGVLKSGEAITIAREKIRVMDGATSTQAGKGAAIGAGIGLATALSVILQVSLDEYRVLRVDEGSLIAGLTLSGGLIGLAVGSAYPKWERVPLRKEPGARPGISGKLLSVHFSF